MKDKEREADALARRARFKQQLLDGSFEQRFAQGVEIRRQSALAWVFLKNLVGVTPFLVSDGSRLEDFVCDQEMRRAVSGRCLERPSFLLEQPHFELRLWQLMDQLEAKHSRFPN